MALAQKFLLVAGLEAAAPEKSALPPRRLGEWGARGCSAAPGRVRVPVLPQCVKRAALSRFKPRHSHRTGRGSVEVLPASRYYLTPHPPSRSALGAPGAQPSTAGGSRHPRGSLRAPPRLVPVPPGSPLARSSRRSLASFGISQSSQLQFGIFSPVLSSPQVKLLCVEDGYRYPDAEPWAQEALGTGGEVIQGFCHLLTDSPVLQGPCQ
ncbi:uncharacterized protein LOC116793570 [Chiroxiphia lanceolata]|uniref:uncharacterized protein LOC116793570 n=1 Tax=Chiroxiphia lanceolata TaxID=296741 RepID=UPI0013CE519B|nr:uncharacterized protein LOC116793570 [Chiroxiphia lanceolata]